MGSWGGNTARRADRMPTMRAQNAMMNDLGTIRINELPLDDTPNSRYVPPRPRRPPVITENSEALNGYRAMAEKGIDDDEAMTVRDLDDLGGPSIYRPTSGPANDFMSEARRPTPSFQGMQTSRNGILLPPGAVVHRFNQEKVAMQNSSAVSNNRVAVAGPQPGSVVASQAAKNPLPPHLRTKKKTETPLSNKPGPENGISLKAAKPVTADISTVSHAREIVVSLPDPVTPKELRKEVQSSVTHAKTAKYDHTSDSSGSMDDEVVIFWTGSCKTWVPEQGKDCVVTIDLKVINAAVGTEGQSLFIMTLPEVFIKKHNMSFYILEIAKSNLCVVKFANPGNGVEEGRYRLKFQDEMTATSFQDRAAKLQRVMGYLSDVAAANDGVGVGASSATEQSASQEQPRLCDLSVTATSAEGSSDVLQEPKTTENTKSSSKAKVNRHAPKESRASTDAITNAFNSLSLNEIKDANMYKANPKRVCYSAEELLEQRASGRAPRGITDVKIPLNRQDKQPRNTSLTQDVLERDRLSMKPLTVHESAKLKDWIIGKRPQSNTEESSQISMPGLSEAVQYQKAAAATAESSAQGSKSLASETKPVNVVVEKNEIKADGTPKEDDKGGAIDEVQMAATATDTIPTTPKSADAGASINPEISVEQTTPVVEASICADPKKPDGQAAASDASCDSAVEFQPPSMDERPSTIVIDQNDQTKKENTASSFDAGASAPAASVVADEQDSSAKKTSPMEVSEQTVPTVPSTTTPTTSSAVHPDILSEIQVQSGQGTATAIPVPHLASSQVPSPLLATPHMNQPDVAYTPQMDVQSMIRGFQCPPAGIVTSVSVTYHISYPGQPNGQFLNAGQENVHAVHHVTDLVGQQTGRAFSPNAQVFQPQSQCQPSQRGPGQNRQRRGLEGSIFATGYSGAKHASSFPGAPFK
ncbi:hypothetical protein LX32DRAFT_709134 [Colletotrichum zoysiae]|uniref:Uncharacterized protein n=1 Tax=Colletotrichum zoysiae TaxID=1216348 RepID=A0AAD9H7H9_9PEZI|nr:hypothetical protein LX32DRAFT_709134 [Colletotrichum zoysiae]